MAEQKQLPLLLNTTSPMGDACVFKNGRSFVVYYKQHGFLPRSISTTDEAEVKSFLMATRVLSEANYDRIMDPETPPVIVQDVSSNMPGGSNSDVDPPADLDDGFDEVVEL